MVRTDQAVPGRCVRNCHKAYRQRQNQLHAGLRRPGPFCAARWDTLQHVPSNREAEFLIDDRKNESETLVVAVARDSMSSESCQQEVHYLARL